MCALYNKDTWLDREIQGKEGWEVLDVLKAGDLFAKTPRSALRFLEEPSNQIISQKKEASLSQCIKHQVAILFTHHFANVP